MRAGPFELIEPIAQGGMAQVWKARHRDLVVAVKFMTLGPSGKAQFADEMRAHARLDHPHIVKVFDFGTLTKSLVPGLEAGMPWMALEHASGGDVSQIRCDMRWVDVRTLTLTVLEALAYAHASGVVHCDLKLANLLLSGPRDPRPGVKLADFGIAQGLELDEESAAQHQVSGTPQVMAPEQIRGALRRFGPWTDIYGLGCLVTRLVTGHFPFEGQAASAVLVSHLTEEPGPLRARFDVPDGLDAWVARALQKQPSQRFSSAFESAESFRDLPIGRHRGLCHPALGYQAPRDRSTAPPSLPLVGAGLALFPVRSWPTIGRGTQEEQLEQALAQCHSERRAKLVVLHGPSGVGVSHLGGRFARWAEIRGKAIQFTHTCLQDEAPTQGLRRFLMALLRCTGLDGAALEEALGEPDVWRHPDPEGVAMARHLLVEGEDAAALRWGVLRRVILDRLDGRAAVVWMDDVHHSADARAFIEHTLRTGLAAPVLFIAGCPDREVFEVEEDVKSISLPGLSPGEMSQLIRFVLPLDADFMAEMVEQAEGLPGRLAAELERWVRAKALKPTAFGYRRHGRLAPRGSASHDVAAVVADLAPGSLLALQRAAVWGPIVQQEVWARLCEDESVGIPIARLQLLERLKAWDLAQEDASGWRFTSGAFRQAVLAECGRRDRQRAHVLAVQVLEGKPQTPDTLVLIARHQGAAGDRTVAIQAYLEALEAQNRSSLVLVLVSELQELLDAEGVSAGDPRRERARLFAEVFRPVTLQSMAASRELLEDARRHGWDRAHARALCSLSMGSSLLGTADEVFSYAEAAIAFARSCDDPTPLFEIAGPLAHSIARVGRPKWAHELLIDTIARCCEHGSPDWILQLRASLVFASFLLGHPLDLAELESLAEELGATGSVARQSKVLNIAGEVARHRRLNDAAKRYYQASLETIRRVGYYGGHLRLNLGLMALDEGDADEAQRWLDSGLQMGVSQSNAMALPVCKAMAFEIAALRGQVEACRSHLRGLPAALNDHPPERDLVDILRRSAVLLQSLDAGLASKAAVLESTHRARCESAGMEVD